ncbi:hypothetical protein KUCAC02_032109, partial [Chaenocephalus aceratus]
VDSTVMSTLNGTFGVRAVEPKQLQKFTEVSAQAEPALDNNRVSMMNKEPHSNAVDTPASVSPAAGSAVTGSAHTHHLTLPIKTLLIAKTLTPSIMQ